MLDELIKEIDELNSQSLPWINQVKLDHIKLMLRDSESQLRNRKSDLHLSASAMAFTDQAGIFIRHPYLHTILLPAGHVEMGEMPFECALREFHEETGLNADPKFRRLIDVNLIDIPANSIKHEGVHQHIDFRYLIHLLPELPGTAELPVFYLDEAKSPNEFSKYFFLIK